MDIAVQAHQLVEVLSPALPYILSASAYAAGKLADGAMEQTGGALVQKLWFMLRGRKDDLDEAAQDVAADPHDSDAQAALRHQVKKLLAEDSSLAAELEKLLEQGRREGVFAVGKRSVAVGGNVSGSIITTGDTTTKKTRKD